MSHGFESAESTLHVRISPEGEGCEAIETDALSHDGEGAIDAGSTRLPREVVLAAGRPSANEELARATVSVLVAGLSGTICEFQAHLHWTLHRLKQCITEHAAIPAKQQRLLHGNAELTDDRTVVGALITNGGGDHRLLQLTPVLRSREVTKLLEHIWASSLGQTPSVLDAAKEHQHNREVVLAAVSRCGLALRYASERLKADRDIVLQAVQWPRALQFAAAPLRADKQIVMAFVMSDCISRQNICSMRLNC